MKQLSKVFEPFDLPICLVKPSGAAKNKEFVVTEDNSRGFHRHAVAHAHSISVRHRNFVIIAS